VVWSQSSIRSRPFLDAAQRVINAEKAVVASLIEPPPPDSIGTSLAFDLSDWDGDPNDPALDPLFFAVDRLVNAARASVGAGAGPRPSAYDDPPPRPAPPPRTAPPPRAPMPAPTPRAASPIQQASPDALSSEAEHWRAIRDSQDPNAFMEYIARYGQRGTFSEVAELKLRQLTAAGMTARPPSPLRGNTARTDTGMPQSRRPEAPRRAEIPVAPPSVAAPMSSRRSEAPRRTRTPSEPLFDRNDLREPPAEGGALRTFIIIAVLGILAVAGGLYFGGGLLQPSDATRAEVPALDREASPGSGEPIEGSVSFADAADAGAPTTGRNTREPPVAPPRSREPERTNERATRAPETNSRTASPTPSNPSPSNSGPVSLAPGSTSPAPSGPSVDGAPAPLPPFIAPTSPEPTTESRPAAPGTVVFTQRPTPRRISELYPQSALRRGVGGRVQLDCRVQYDLSLTCSVASESPADAGFGRAALAASTSYRARATLSDGASAVGAQTRIAVNFQAPQ
jgi:protein TonB